MWGGLGCRGGPGAPLGPPRLQSREGVDREFSRGSLDRCARRQETLDPHTLNVIAALTSPGSRALWSCHVRIATIATAIIPALHGVVTLPASFQAPGDGPRHRWHRDRGRDDTKTTPQPNRRTHREGGRDPGRGERRTPPASGPPALLHYQRGIRKKGVPRRHRPSRATRRPAPQAQRSLLQKSSTRTAALTNGAWRRSKLLLVLAQKEPSLWLT